MQFPSWFPKIFHTSKSSDSSSKKEGGFWAKIFSIFSRNKTSGNTAPPPPLAGGRAQPLPQPSNPHKKIQGILKKSQEVDPKIKEEASHCLDLFRSKFRFVNSEDPFTAWSAKINYSESVSGETAEKGVLKNGELVSTLPPGDRLNYHRNCHDAASQESEKYEKVGDKANTRVNRYTEALADQPQNLEIQGYKKAAEESVQLYEDARKAAEAEANFHLAAASVETLLLTDSVQTSLRNAIKKICGEPVPDPVMGKAEVEIQQTSDGIKVKETIHWHITRNEVTKKGSTMIEFTLPPLNSLQKGQKMGCDLLHNIPNRLGSLISDKTKVRDRITNDSRPH